MANAYIEWEDGSASTLEEYESFLEATEEILNWKPSVEELKALNLQFGYPGRNGEML